MIRERALKVVLVLVGLFFLAGFYFLTISLWHAKWHAEQSEAEPMFLSVYITLGIFLLLSARNPRNPSANRSLIGSRHGRVLLMPLLWWSWHSRLRADAENF